MSSNKQEFIREVIEMYQSLPCLWKIKSVDYSNRYKKKQAYEQLIELFQRHNPTETITTEIVRKKIQGLRTVYKKELNKVEKASKSGAGTEELYVPKLWYYDLLAFIRDQEVPRTITSLSLGPGTQPEVRSDTTVGDDRCEAGPIVTGGDDEIAGTSEETAEAPLPRRISSTRKRQPNNSSSTDLMDMAKKILDQHSRPSICGFAQLTDERLRKLDDKQRVHVERVMLEALNKAAEGKLTDSSKVCDVEHRQQSSWDQVPWMRMEPPPHLQHDPPAQYPMFPPTNQFFSPQRQHLNDSNKQYQNL
ncbi:uncharacterized protein ACNLHF_006454 isoform 1-T1 [Anomaloglossus baeobatrachus]|uniref:uncharacterized protein LOC142250570 n=1 Tax=Anomaloglossus baeobatrachus TaxID=238106 RepID=UPI003F4F4ABF